MHFHKCRKGVRLPLEIFNKCAQTLQYSGILQATFRFFGWSRRGRSGRSGGLQRTIGERAFTG